MSVQLHLSTPNSSVFDIFTPPYPLTVAPSRATVVIFAASVGALQRGGHRPTCCAPQPIMLRTPPYHAAHPTLSCCAPHPVMLRAVAASRKSSCKDLSLHTLDSATDARNDKIRRVDVLFAQLRQAQPPFASAGSATELPSYRRGPRLKPGSVALFACCIESHKTTHTCI